MSREITGKTVFGMWLFSKLGPNSSGKSSRVSASLEPFTVRVVAGQEPPTAPVSPRTKEGDDLPANRPSSSLSCTGHPAHRPYIQGCHLTVSPSCPSRLQPWRCQDYQRDAHHWDQTEVSKCDNDKTEKKQKSKECIFHQSLQSHYPKCLYSSLPMHRKQSGATA